jgi:hypothetical protein
MHTHDPRILQLCDAILNTLLIEAKKLNLNDAERDGHIVFAAGMEFVFGWVRSWISEEDAIALKDQILRGPKIKIFRCPAI